MARVNVYLPDELAEQARTAGMNISAVTQDAIRRALAGFDTDLWVERLDRLPRTNISHDAVITALDDARTEFGT